MHTFAESNTHFRVKAILHRGHRKRSLSGCEPSRAIRSGCIDFDELKELLETMGMVLTEDDFRDVCVAVDQASSQRERSAKIKLKIKKTDFEN